MLRKLKRLFCTHENTNWFRKVTPFQSLSGERHYEVCARCGKQVGERYFEYEGDGYK